MSVGVRSLKLVHTRVSVAYYIVTFGLNIAHATAYVSDRMPTLLSAQWTRHH